MSGERTAEQYKLLLDLVVNIAHQTLLIPAAEVDAIQATIARAHSAGPILEPTLYRDRMSDLQVQEELMMAFAKFHAAVSKMKNRLAAAAERKR